MRRRRERAKFGGRIQECSQQMFRSDERNENNLPLVTLKNYIIENYL